MPINRRFVRVEALCGEGGTGGKGVHGGDVMGAVAQPRHTEQSCSVRLKELRDRADDLEDVQDA